jgi:hypothetical protein
VTFSHQTHQVTGAPLAVRQQPLRSGDGLIPGGEDWAMRRCSQKGAPEHQTLDDSAVQVLLCPGIAQFAQLLVLRSQVLKVEVNVVLVP